MAALPTLLLRTDNGRIVTKDDSPAPALAVKKDSTGQTDAIIFEVREPVMDRSYVNEARILEVGTAFLASGKEFKGFLGKGKDGTTNVGVMTSRLGTRTDLWDGATTQQIPPDFADKLMGMSLEMFELAKANGLVPKGKEVKGELIRFDVQYRKVENAPANEVDDTSIFKIFGAHLDAMWIVPKTFAPNLQDKMDSFRTKVNNTQEGIAVLIYLQSPREWSGTELCLPSTYDPERDTVTFKPTTGDVVVINDRTYHGVCNNENLKGAQFGEGRRVLLRVTMPYDN